jgi:hypothetical protein
MKIRQGQRCIIGFQKQRSFNSEPSTYSRDTLTSDKDLYKRLGDETFLCPSG